MENYKSNNYGSATSNNHGNSQVLVESKDEVDFVVVSNNNNNNNNHIIHDSNKAINNRIVDNNKDSNFRNSNSSSSNNNSANVPKSATSKANPNRVPNNKDSTPNSKSKKKGNGSAESPGESPKKVSSTKERLSIFSFTKKISQKTPSPPLPPPPSKDASTSPTEKSLEKSAEQSQKSLSSPLASLPCTPHFVPIGTPPRQHKFVKSSSIARLLGNTYNAKKFEKAEQKRLGSGDSKFNTFAGRRRAANGPYLERFKRSKEDGDDVAINGGITLTTDSRDLFGGSRSELVCLEHRPEGVRASGAASDDVGAMAAFRTISRSLGKLWWKRSQSVEISTPDPEFKVSYLGNVLTGWAKGEGCVEKQLNTLWRNYTQNTKPDVIMRIKVCASGLKATTRQHGLTEYWANRITHCCAPKNYPRVFCWIYRHEGRKLKHELRCHAVLCSKEKIVQDICATLKENLERALREFKREKILKQNARLSLANAAYDNPSLPRRKILLSVGGNNYRPPLERSKSAPKLMSIEEAIGEEEGDDVEETNEPEMKPCCQKDSLYPAMTLGRRRCRRGHSIRRTGKTRPCFGSGEVFVTEPAHKHAADGCCSGGSKVTKEADVAAPSVAAAAPIATTEAAQTPEAEQRNSYGSDDSDDFEKLLKYNDYDSSATLANELLPYFEMQLHKNTNSLSLGSLSELKTIAADAEDDDGEPLSLLPTINSDPSADPDAEFSLSVRSQLALDDEEVVVGMRRAGVCSDGEEDYLDPLDEDDMYFRQATILKMLHRSSMRKMANLSLSSDEGSSSIETNASSNYQPLEHHHQLQYRHQMQSSISSDASSTATSVSAALRDGLQSEQQRKQNQLSPDSDEGSISSGCETASTVTANQDDLSLKYRQSNKPSGSLELCGNEPGALDEEPITVEEIYQRLESRLHGRHNSDATTFSSSSSITLKLGGNSPATSLSAGLDGGCIDATAGSGASKERSRRMRRQSAAQREQCTVAGDDSDSECSDESGYVEFQEQAGSKSGGQPPAASMPPLKPQPPPKPLPRRLLATKNTTTAV